MAFGHSISTQVAARAGPGQINSPGVQGGSHKDQALNPVIAMPFAAYPNHSCPDRVLKYFGHFR
jgi:hypothetical protein